MSVQKQLRAALKDLGGAFESDELAYLTLTSKVEGPVRDRLAWALRKRLSDAYLVAREWKRADLAVLTADGLPVAQVEAKVLCTFNTLSTADTKRYIGYLVADAQKMAKRCESDRYLLSVVFDVHGTVPADLEGVVKYRSGINRYMKNHPDGRGRKKAAEAWTKALGKKFGCSTHVQMLNAGSVWGLDVTIDCYLTGPLTNP